MKICSCICAGDTAPKQKAEVPKGKLHVTVVKADNLKQVDTGKKGAFKCDPIAVVTVGSRPSCDTKPVTADLNPKFSPLGQPFCFTDEPVDGATKVVIQIHDVQPEGNSLGYVKKSVLGKGTLELRWDAKVDGPSKRHKVKLDRQGEVTVEISFERNPDEELSASGRSKSKRTSTVPPPTTATVTVAGVSHEDGELGTKFFFEGDAWANMVEAKSSADWAGRRFPVEQNRYIDGNSEAIWKGQVVVQRTPGTDTLGYGKRNDGSASGQWEVGDVIYIKKPSGGCAIS